MVVLDVGLTVINSKIMRYRRLTNEELAELEKEFVNFLVVNTVTADDWEKLKINDPDKAEVYIEDFSDLVLEKVLTNISYLEHRSERDMMVFKCTEDKLCMLGLTVTEDIEVDLNNEASIASLLLTSGSLEGKVKVFKSEKDYVKDRSLELFELIQTGCLITDEKMYDTLMSLY